MEEKEKRAIDALPPTNQFIGIQIKLQFLIKILAGNELCKKKESHEIFYGTLHCGTSQTHSCINGHLAGVISQIKEGENIAPLTRLHRDWLKRC